MSNKKSSGITGKGYYIALILCAAAIGISGYLYYQNAHADRQTLQEPVGEVTGVSGQEDVAVAATDPVGQEQAPVQATVPVTAEPLATIWPVAGQTVAPYAMESLSYNETTRDWRVHNGIDIAAQEGTQVVAAADGVVYTTYTDDAYGTTVVISHEGGYTTKYSSLAGELAVKAGDAVTMGQTIGTVGETALLETAIGPHVHFSVLCMDEPVDPQQFLTAA